VREFLISRGARHHIFSAIAIGDEAEVRRIVAADPAALASRQSRNENNRTPLQLAVVINRPAMVSLLVELGADPLGVDGWGMPAAAYVETPEIDRPIMERIHSLGVSEIVSADRGARRATAVPIDLLASVTLGDWTAASRMLDDNPSLLDGQRGVLHLLAKRGDTRGLRWLLDRGADPNGRWAHFDSEVTPLHLAILADHAEAARLLLSAGADITIRDTKHDADALGWAEFFNRAAIVDAIKQRG
jgi:ankyrin repeat protein